MHPLFQCHFLDLNIPYIASLYYIWWIYLTLAFPRTSCFILFLVMHSEWPIGSLHNWWPTWLGACRSAEQSHGVNTSCFSIWLSNIHYSAPVYEKLLFFLEHKCIGSAFMIICKITPRCSTVWQSVCTYALNWHCFQRGDTKGLCVCICICTYIYFFSFFFSCLFLHYSVVWCIKVLKYPFQCAMATSKWICENSYL